jgi:arylsulfatase A-like enzyme
MIARLLSMVPVLALMSATAAATARPNVVLLMGDDHGWGETGYNGHPHVQTPVLDEMARTGLRLDRFYAGSAVCSPTRASVMTGRHANRSGVLGFNFSTRPEEITLPQILQQAGYRTGHFGKWHLGPVKKESPVSPNRMGFDESLAHDNFFDLNPALSRDGATPKVFQGESSEILIGEALAFIRRAHGEGKPFFVVVWFGSPHGPFAGLEKDVALYDDVPDPKMRQRFAEITAMDRSIGTLREGLRKLGVADDTLLWFNSDNGIPPKIDSFNGRWSGVKGGIGEGSFLGPGLIEWPAVITTPRASAVPCVTSDILPTVLDLTGVPYPDPRRPLDGISLRALIVDGTMTARPSPIGFWKYDQKGVDKHPRWIPAELARGNMSRGEAGIDFQNFRHPVPKTADFGGRAAWTDNRYKLITAAANRKDGEADGRIRLYDLVNDPEEATNIAQDHPEIVAKMMKQLHEWQASVERSLSGADYAKAKDAADDASTD